MPECDIEVTLRCMGPLQRRVGQNRFAARGAMGFASVLGAAMGRIVADIESITGRIDNKVAVYLRCRSGVRQ